MDDIIKTSVDGDSRLLHCICLAWLDIVHDVHDGQMKSDHVSQRITTAG
jgi:hypothetical protein